MGVTLATPINSAAEPAANATIYVTHISPPFVSIEGGEMMTLSTLEIPEIEKASAVCWITTVENSMKRQLNTSGFGFEPTTLSPGVIQLPATISADRFDVPTV